ncbi:helix-turn-helix domain-containing protein [Bifidobacterium xylocopae]|uniref:DNA-binding protein n=1 Tax=Bifidobacterium xylocopae TaxID=2493119 RepID=A0A366KAR0_9BIFI|nr:helix-turn-helix domain-containing protein [Bifidobacterium xylocopae]RBP98816.1 DNA-binding protein [Bifidobacterium xylocopae]
MSIGEILSGYPDLLEVKEVSEILHKNPHTIYGWLRTGALPGTKCGGGWLIAKSDIIEYLQSRSNNTDTR